MLLSSVPEELAGDLFFCLGIAGNVDFVVSVHYFHVSHVLIWVVVHP